MKLQHYPVRTTRRKKSLAKNQKKEQYKAAKKESWNKLVEKYSRSIVTNGGQLGNGNFALASLSCSARLDFDNDYRIEKNKLRKLYYGY